MYSFPALCELRMLIMTSGTKHTKPKNSVTTEKAVKLTSLSISKDNRKMYDLGHPLQFVKQTKIL